MPNRKGLPSAVKNVKDREVNSSLLMLKNVNPLMAVSYSPKKGKTCLCLRQHMKIQILTQWHTRKKTLCNRFLQHSTIWGRHRQ